MSPKELYKQSSEAAPSSSSVEAPPARTNAGELQKPFEGHKKLADMDPMTRWVSEGKAYGPWSILDVVGNGGTCQLLESKVVKMEDGWSVRVKQGSAQGEETSTR
ncbi:hypothetical protein EG329_005686 [Mollisiaceae sp. DMI_Dod_QoI]|nr:hypothetical protein EG329_005686 [Helotiales sp. DMI_Dod_QoI]